jgi:hypothetical protein
MAVKGVKDLATNEHEYSRIRKIYNRGERGERRGALLSCIIA